MRITLILILIVSISFSCSSQTEIYSVTYKQYSNENYVENADIDLLFSDNICYLSKNEESIRSFTDFKTNNNITIIKNQDKLYKTVVLLDSLKEPIFDNQTEEILGYQCQHARYFSFSNTIDVWYTEESDVKGSPYRSYLPSTKALVLKIIINGNRSILAQEINKKTDIDVPDYPSAESIEISEAQFEELKIKSRYTIVPVFEQHNINFDTDYDNPKIDISDNEKVYHFSYGTILLKKVTLPEINRDGAYVFAKLISWSNGDAYDRTGSIFMIPANTEKSTILAALENDIKSLPIYIGQDGKEYQGVIKTEEYNPPIELMRFFTSFGVRHFNELREINNYPWQDSVIYKQEITNLIPNDCDEIWVGAFIGNYDKGGHYVTLDLEFFPSFEETETKKKAIIPLFNTLNILEASGQNYGKLFKTDTLEVEFEIDEILNNPKLLYTTTGHGGWENGDEFIPKLNQVFLDGEPLFEIVPWRTDCGTYRFANPASGNFSNGLSSSDLSRSNWCPGTLTPPNVIPIENLEKGKHTIKVIIDAGDDEGTSFSHWSVSGVLVGDKK